MSLLAWARILLALGLVLLIGRRAMPALALRFKPGLLRCTFLGSDEESKVLEGSPVLQDGLGQLKRLHYFLIGVKVEKMPLWGGRFAEVAMAARDQSAFASIVLHPFGAPASMYFYTPLSGGGMVFTRDYTGGAEADLPNVSVRNVPTEDLAAIHHAHQERVAALRARGFSPDVRPSQSGRIAATHAFYASSYYRRLSGWRDALAGLSMVGSILLLAWAVLAPWLGH